jgi:hypothetical protein
VFTCQGTALACMRLAESEEILAEWGLQYAGDQAGFYPGISRRKRRAAEMLVLDATGKTLCWWQSKIRRHGEGPRSQRVHDEAEARR